MEQRERTMMDQTAHRNGSTPHASELSAILPTPLEDLPLSDVDYLQALLDSVDVHYADELPDYQQLRQPDALQRLQHIRETDAALYDGVFQVWVRRRGRDLFWPEVDEKIRTWGTPVVPAVLGPTLPLCPSLPAMAHLDPDLSEGAAPWLDAYCAHSQYWAPRAARGFHQAVGIWVLSTIAARRVCVHLGREKFPMLFLALIAPSTLYTKSTTAHIGQKSIRKAGCGFFLTPDRITPQALVRRMSGKLKEDYGDLDMMDQETARRDVAFAGQRGWYYDEWGTMLGQMRRQDSAIAEFHGLLKVLDDGAEDFQNETILRGLESVHNPALALLSSATPADLAPYMRPGTAWWRDGFWPRFAFITPLEDECPSIAPQPRGLDTLPAPLVADLHTWHMRLGLPTCTVEAKVDKKGNPTGAWKTETRAVEPTVLEIAPDVLTAYQMYNTALMSLVLDKTIEADLSGCYGRFHEKALRVAILLASFSGASRIELPHWAYAQEVVESWRAMLHQVLVVAAASEPMSREQILEEKMAGLLHAHGAMTARQIQQHVYRCTSKELQQALASMVQVGRLVTIPKGKTQLYAVPMDAPPEAEPLQESAEVDVPF